MTLAEILLHNNIFFYDPVNSLNQRKQKEKKFPLFKESTRTPDNKKFTGNELIINQEVISKFEKNLQLTFINTSGEEGNLCLANNEEVTPAFRTIFTRKDLLLFVAGKLQNISAGKNSTPGTAPLYIPFPENSNIFWRMVEAGRDSE